MFYSGNIYVYLFIDYIYYTFLLTYLLTFELKISQFFRLLIIKNIILLTRHIE